MSKASAFWFLAGALVLLAMARSSGADNECGAAPAGGGEVTCDAGSYNPLTDGNIVYLLGRDAATRDKGYRISIKGLLGEMAVTLDRVLDPTHAYDPWKPSAVWLAYAGSESLTVNVSNIELKTGITEAAGTYTVPGDGSKAGFRGLHVWLENRPENEGSYSAARDLRLNVRNSDFRTRARAISAVQDWNGAVFVDVRDTRIRTYGAAGHGIVGFHDAVGDIAIYAERVDIVAADGYGIAGFVWAGDRESPNPYSGPATLGITAKDSTVRVSGASRAGLYAFHRGSGRVDIVLEDSRIEAMDGASGIWVRHLADPGSRRFPEIVEGTDLDVTVTVDGGGIATADSHGIRISRFAESTGTNTVRVGSSVRAGGGGDGINTQGNTDITISGTVSSESGNAITNAGGDLTLCIEGSGRVHGPVINEAGHEIDICVGEDTVVRNRQIVQETGSAGPFDTTVAAVPGGFVLDSRYAPRAAVYEALPGVLLRLDDLTGLAGARVRSAETPLWIRLAGDTGFHAAGRSTVGAKYEIDRVAAEVGIDFPFDEDVTGSVGARMVSGRADVGAPTGGGKIDAMGYGASFALAWRGPGGWYGSGNLSATWYDLDLSSESRGRLKRDVAAFVYSMGVEAGRRLALNGKTRLTARGWLDRSAAIVGGFTDAVGARVSAVDGDRFRGGVGGTVETDLAWNGGELSLRGSLGLERALDGSGTAVRVSGARLTSEASKTKLMLGLGATWDWGSNTALAVGYRAHGIGAKGKAHSGGLELRSAF